MLITREMLKMAEEAREEARRMAQEPVAELVCAACNTYSDGMHYSRWRDDKNGFKELSCDCGKVKMLE